MSADFVAEEQAEDRQGIMNNIEVLLDLHCKGIGNTMRHLVNLNCMLQFSRLPY